MNSIWWRNNKCGSRKLETEEEHKIVTWLGMRSIGIIMNDISYEELRSNGKQKIQVEVDKDALDGWSGQGKWSWGKGAVSLCLLVFIIALDFLLEGGRAEQVVQFGRASRRYYKFTQPDKEWMDTLEFGVWMSWGGSSGCLLPCLASLLARFRSSLRRLVNYPSENEGPSVLGLLDNDTARVRDTKIKRLSWSRITHDITLNYITWTLAGGITVIMRLKCVRAAQLRGNSHLARSPGR